MAGLAGQQALERLAADVLAGREVSNESAASLLPILAAGGPEAAQVEQAGALRYLREGEQAQLPYMATLARQACTQSGWQQRGLLVVAKADRMGGQEDMDCSRSERLQKRARIEGPGSAGAAAHPAAAVGPAAQQAAVSAAARRYYPSPGPGNATTFHPSRASDAHAEPTLAVRRFAYLDLDVGQKAACEQLHKASRRLPKGDPEKKVVGEQVKQLPGTTTWTVAEFQPMRRLPPGEQQQCAITATAKEDSASLLWLSLDNLPAEAFTAERDIVEVCDLHSAADGYRLVKKVDTAGRRIGITGVSSAPAQLAVQPGTSIWVRHRPDPSLVVYHFRLPAGTQPPQAAAASAAGAGAIVAQQLAQFQPRPLPGLGMHAPPLAAGLCGSLADTGLGRYTFPLRPDLQVPATGSQSATRLRLPVDPASLQQALAVMGLPQQAALAGAGTAAAAAALSGSMPALPGAPPAGAVPLPHALMGPAGPSLVGGRPGGAVPAGHAPEAAATASPGHRAWAGPDPVEQYLQPGAGEDAQFRRLTVGQAPPAELPPNLSVPPPATPALDVRNDAVFHRQVHMLGDVVAPAILELSDERYKTEIAAVHGALSLIERIQVVEFSWQGAARGQRVTGFLAQQLRGVVPEAVKVREDGTHFLCINKLTPFITGAVQELSSRLAAQEGEQEELAEQVEQLWAVVLAGGWHNLVERQAARTAGAKLLPRGKALGGAVQPSSGPLLAGPAAGAARLCPPSAAARRLAREHFVGKVPLTIAGYLQRALQEPNGGLLRKYQTWCHKFGPEVMAQLLLTAQQPPVEPATEPAAGAQTGSTVPEAVVPLKPTAAARFIQLANQLERRMAQEERTEEAAAAAAAPGERMLFDYQAQMLGLAAEGRNLIIVASTGAGKTEVAVRHSAALLQADPLAKVVFLAPTVVLADQQAAVFRTSPPFNRPASGFRVECRCGTGASVTPQEWPSLLRACSVLVLTPAIFLKLVDSGAARFEDIRLLAIDECHHARKSHPVSLILEHYKQWLATREADVAARGPEEMVPPTRPSGTQILGFTASPASETTLNKTADALEQLAGKLQAEYLVLDPEHPELLQHVVPAQERRIEIELRQEDVSFAQRLGGSFLLAALGLLQEHLQPLYGEGQLPADLCLPPSAMERVRWGDFSPEVERWCVAVQQHVLLAPGVEEAFKDDVVRCAEVVREALCALSVARNLGFEAAARRLAQLVAGTAQEVLGVGSDVLLGASPAGSRAFGTASASPSGGAPFDAAAAAVGGLAMQLLRMLCNSVLGDSLEAAYRDGIAGTPKSPKYREMRRVLMQYRERPGAHGICFVRTRADARVLHSILQSDAELGCFEAHLLTGHGAGEGMAVNGMAVNGMAVNGMAWRRGHGGRHLLVSTAAGEEGLDIPTCQFVIRFNSPQTGREKLQSKGRTRAHGSVYYELIEVGSTDERAAIKSETQVANQRHVLRGMEVLRIG